MLAGTELIEKCNKILMLSNKHGWECAEEYSCNSLADNLDNKKKIKKSLKETKSVKEEMLKAQRASRKSGSIPKKAFPNYAMSQIPACCSVNPEYNLLLPTLRSARALCQILSCRTTK